MRSVPEWIGRDDDHRPPMSVRLRVFARHEGRCHISKVKILAGDKWDLEHVRPLHLAKPGENLNRESNLAPALKAPHRVKTGKENKAKAKVDRTRAKHLGQWPKSPGLRPHPTKKRTLSGQVVER